MRPPDLFLLETSAGVYEARWTVPADVDAGRYDVVATLTVGGIRLAATPPAALELVRQVEEVTVPPLAPTPPPAEPRLPAAPHVHGYGRLPPPPPVLRQPVGPQNKSHADLPAWAEALANTLAYAVVFYGRTAGLHAVNIKFGWLVAIALLGVVWMLRRYLIDPIAALIKAIILTVFHVLVDLVEFLAKWLDGILHYFQGDVLRAIERILITAAFLWVWELALQIPALGQLLEFIVDSAGKITSWVSDGFHFVLGQLHTARLELEQGLADALDSLGEVGQALRRDLLGDLDARFGELIRFVGHERNALLAHVDVVGNVLSAHVNVLGTRLALVPKDVRDHLVAVYSAAGADANRP